MRLCQYCSEEISDYVIKCRHCGTWLVEDPPEFWKPEDKVEVVVDEAPPPPPPEPEIMIIPGGGDTLPAVMILPDDTPARVSPRLGR